MTQHNLLRVALRDFRAAMKPFAAKRRKLGSALLAFEAGYLSIESGSATAVMHAEGSWQGRAGFSPEVLRAMATYPPSQDPITIAYAEGHLLIGTMTIPCQWSMPSKELAHQLENPSLMDLIALGRTISRAEYLGTELGRQIRRANEISEKRILTAAANLEMLEVTEADIRALVEARLVGRSV